MKTLIVLIGATLIGTACKDTSDRREGEMMRKPVESDPWRSPTVETPGTTETPTITETQTAPETPTTPTAEVPTTPPPEDEEFVRIRTSYSTTARDRLNRVDQRLSELANSTEMTARDAAAGLRARRDQLASRLDTVGVQAKTSWDQFTSDVQRSFDELERDIDSALD